MQATTQQRAALVTFLQQRINALITTIQSFTAIDAGYNEEETRDLIEDYVNTVQALTTVYGEFLLSNCIATLIRSIRRELDTMIYEEEFEQLMCGMQEAGFTEFTHEFVYSLSY